MVWPFAEACVSTHWPSKLPVAGAVPPVEGSRPSGSSPPPGAFVACGAAAVCVYMAAGLIGVPVFTQGGGPWYVMNPTFGYIAGFAAGAWCAGKISRLRARRSFRLLLAASFANIAVVYLFGVVYYWFAASYFAGSHVAVSALLLYGVALAAPGDIALCFVSAALAAKILPRIGGGSL